MRIQHVKIRNFRAVKEFDGDFGNITSFIGYNGSGKSSIIRAINWFFEGHRLNETDYFKNFSGEQNDEISVEIKFISLNESEKSQFKKYVKNDDSMTIMRSQNIGEAKSKLFGSPNIIPEIEKIRSISGLKEQRDELNKLFENEEIFASSEDAQIINNKKATRAEFDNLLTRLEMHPDNFSKYKTRELEEATNFQGFSGGSEIRDAAGFIFLPAGNDMANQFDSSVKGSALEILSGSLIKSALSDSLQEWQNENSDILNQLQELVHSAASTGLKEKTDSVNHYLQSYLPNMKLKLDAGLDDWKPKVSPNAIATLEYGNNNFPIENQGHGVQRATLLALLQGIADMRSDLSNDDSPQLTICIEEPEVYQHPQQARSISRSFKIAAGNSSNNIQFIYATHSPYFIDPETLETTYRISQSPNGARIFKGEKKGIVLTKSDEMYKYFEKSLIEGLFAKACLVVEGDTDSLIFKNIPVTPRRFDYLESYGVSVIEAGSSKSLLTIASLLISYGVPTYIIHDGDSDLDICFERGKVKNEILEYEKNNKPLSYSEKLNLPSVKEVLTSWEDSVSRFVESCANYYSPVSNEPLSTGLDKFSWGAGMAIGKYVCILKHDLESELEQWWSFMQAVKNNPNLNTDLRKNKKAGIYLSCLHEANDSDRPNSFQAILSAVRSVAKTEN